jgi:ADP-heptose:LPS heptosyltransferase
VSGATTERGEPVLVFRIGSLGDTVVALPALRTIRRRHAGSRVTLLTNTPADGGLKAASAIQVLDGTGLVDDFIEYPHGSLSPGKLFSVVQKIRSTGPKLCYFLMPNRSQAQARRDRLFLRLAGIRRIVGLDPGRLATRAPAAGGSLWESEAGRLMRAVGEDAYQLQPSDFALGIQATEKALALQKLKASAIEGPYIVVSIGAKSPVNDWGDSRWIECLRLLGHEAAGHALVAIGSTVESERSDRLLRDWPGRRANFCGQLSPRESAAVLAGARLFLGHDSGPMHLSAAVETPTVAVFSGRNLPGPWFPFAQEKNVFYNDVPCRGCGLEVCIEKGQRCILEIEPRSVAQRAIGILAATGSKAADVRGLGQFSGSLS